MARQGERLIEAYKKRECEKRWENNMFFLIVKKN